MQLFCFIVSIKKTYISCLTVYPQISIYFFFKETSVNFILVCSSQGCSCPLTQWSNSRWSAVQAPQPINFCGSYLPNMINIFVTLAQLLDRLSFASSVLQVYTLDPAAVGELGSHYPPPQPHPFTQPLLFSTSFPNPTSLLSPLRLHLCSGPGMKRIWERVSLLSWDDRRLLWAVIDDSKVWKLFAN